ncbi:hypothetical protein T484DRAFT_1825412, partial [Baffinella frigidus]
GIENILKCGERNLSPAGTNQFVLVVEMCGGVDKIEELQMCGGVGKIEEFQRHENHKIYDMAVKILENYFGVDDEEEEPMQDQGAGGFAFKPEGGAPQGGFQFGAMQ